MFKEIIYQNVLTALTVRTLFATNLLIILTLKSVIEKVQGDTGEKTGLWTFAINQFINTEFFYCGTSWPRAL